MSGHYRARYVVCTALIMAISGAFVILDWVALGFTGGDQQPLARVVGEAVIAAIAGALLADVLIWLIGGLMGRTGFVLLFVSFTVQLLVTAASWTVVSGGSVNPGPSSLPLLSWICLAITAPLVLIRLLAFRRIISQRRQA